MKNGKPSLIFDIRFFHSDRNHDLASHELNAYGRRLAWYLNGEGLSLGAYHSLYLCFRPSMEPGEVKITDEGGDWWQRYTYVGVSHDFPDTSSSDETAMQGTLAALKCIRPDACELIDQADCIVRRHGGDLRFLIRSKPYKRFTLRIASTIGAHPAESLMYVSVARKDSCNFIDLKPVALTYYWESFSLAASIVISDIEIEESSDGSFTARWRGTSLESERLEASEALLPPKPFYSKRVIFQ